MQWELPDDEIPGPRGPIFPDFQRALCLWQQAREDLGTSEQTGPIGQRARRRLRIQGGAQLRVIGQFIGTLRHQQVILELERNVSAVITGSTDEVFLMEGDHIVSIMAEPVVNSIDYPFILPLRISVPQLTAAVSQMPPPEVYIEAEPFDIRAFYQFEMVY